MTLEQFNAAGAQARRATAAAPSLRGLPGFVGIVLRDGKIAVQGSGSGLTARIAELNRVGPDEFTLEAAAGVKTPAKEAAPATASSAPELAGSADQLFQAYVREVGPAGLQAVAYADGHFIIRTGGTNTPEAKEKDPAATMLGSLDQVSEPVPGKISAADFVSRYANVELETGAGIKTQEDFFGGQGIVIDNATICSAGFGAFDAGGLPLVLTAGHCAEDGTASRAEIEPATAATAGGATTALPAVRKLLGTFGFSQFGGPNNSPITGSESSPGNIGTDIAVIRDLRPGLKIQPSVTKWRGDGPTFTDADPANPGPTAVKIIGTAAPYQGQAVCRSGRTEGWSCGSVAETGIYVAGGNPTAGTSCLEAPAVPVTPCNLRAFRGFLSYDVQSSGGDSGGPWISGNYAVGTHSAGEPQGAPQNFAVATTLDDALNHIPGPVQLQLFLNKPELAGPANDASVVAGGLIRGRVPTSADSPRAANSNVRITVGGLKPLAVPVDSNGDWSFVAPFPAGQLSFSAETVHGFSRSGAVDFSVTVARSALTAPVITSPAEAATLRNLITLSGVGAPGAKVLISGDAAGSGVVGLDGHWSVPVAGNAYGRISVRALQTSPGVLDSAAATRNFIVVPTAPAIVSIVGGRHFSQGSLPGTITGTGIDGADVTVSIDGISVGAAQAGAAGVGAKAVVLSLAPHVLAAAGHWSVQFPAGLAVGLHTLTVSQSVDGVASPPATVSFTLDAASVATGKPDQAQAQAPVRPAGQQQGAPAQPPAAQPIAARPLAAGPQRASAPPAPVPSSPVSPSDVSVTAEGAAPGGTSSGNAGQLAGFGGLLPVAGLAAGVLLLGAAVVAFGRRRRQH